MKPIKNESQLQTVIIESMRQSMESLAKNITDQLMKNINERIYSSGSSSQYYQRTYQFFDAIIMPKVEVKGNKVSVEVGMDYTKLKPQMGGEGQFNKHMGFPSVDSWRGMTVGEALLSWWDYGTADGIVNLRQTNYWYDVFGDRAYSSDPNYKKLDDLIDSIIHHELGEIGIVYKKK
jgi:hypothetical protein